MSITNNSYNNNIRLALHERSSIAEVRIRLVHPSRDKDSAEKFIRGHEQVLINHNIEVYAKDYSWVDFPFVYMLVAESLDGGICYGGCRIQLWDNEHSLPFEELVGYLDPSIHKDLKQLGPSGLLEIGGLWNSRVVAGLGLGSEHLVRAAIAVSSSLGVNQGFSFCSPFVTKLADCYGFKPYERWGLEGKFPFPDDRWMSTIVYQRDLTNLPGALPDEIMAIQALRDMPIQQREYFVRGKSLTIHFDLQLKTSSTD